MSKPWTPERNVDPSLAARLITEQFPQLASARIEMCGLGWDNVVYRVGDQLYFRFPVRADAIDGVTREIEWLPRLEAAGLPVPRLRHIGRAGESYPWPFFGYEPIVGGEACDLKPTGAQRAALAKPLGRFLRALHARSLFEDATQRGLPVDPIGRLDMQKRARMTRERMATVKEAGIVLDYAALDATLAAAEKLPRQPATALVHGDLHFRHVILHPNAAFSGVIDWGDLHLNSPAVDLQLAYSMLPPDARNEFWSEYAVPIDESCRVITRAFAVFLNVALLYYALSERLTVIQSEAELALGWI